MDIYAKIPSHYSEKELTLKKRIAQKLTRGKIDFCMVSEPLNDTAENQINTNLVKKYMQDLKSFDTEHKAAAVDFLKIAMQLPDALQPSERTLDEAHWQKILVGVDSVLEQTIQYRIQEGKALEKDCKNSVENLERLSEQIEFLDKERLEHVRSRLKKSVAALQIQVEENRFEQEILFYLEKLDINEEKVRLKNHLVYFTQVLEQETAQGKKLGFIAQEIGREINTIGSKANFAPVQKIVVAMKTHLEKIKEQLLNVL